MKKQLSILSAALLAVAVSASANAGVVVDWDLTGMAGAEPGRTSFSSAAGIAGLDLLRAPGLTGATGANSMNTSGWNGQATDYFSFGFNVASGYEADLSSLVIATRSSATGPGTMGLFYSGDSYSNALYTFTQSPGSNYVNSVVNLSGLQNLSGTVEFRVAQIGTTAANGGTTGTAGTFRIAEYYDGTNYTNLQFNGTVAAVPEADTWAMLLAGLGLMGLVVRRKTA